MKPIRATKYIEATSRSIKIKNTDLTLEPISIPEEYAKEWNERCTDFLVLCRDGKIISNSYYRKGGLFHNKGLDFLHIIKYTEDYYDKNLTSETKKNPAARKHLKGRFCLINKEGKETKVFDQFGSSYLLCNAIYSVDRNYYSTFTNELICQSYSTMDSENFYFLSTDNSVYKINKHTGHKEIFT